MRLARDLAGTYEGTKDSLQRDLVTLQRAFDQNQQQLIAAQSAILAIQTQLAAQRIAVGANGQVSGLPSTGLKTVAHDQSMFGQGTAISPLRVSQTFVTGLVTSSPVLVADFTLTSAQVVGSGTTPITVIAGVPGSVIVPIMITALYTKNNASWTNGSTVMNFRWATAVGNVAAQVALVLNSNFPGLCIGNAMGIAFAANSGNGSNPVLGDALKMFTSAVLSTGTGTFGPMRMRINYTLVTP